jgi:four helix bundle protein
MRTKSSVQGPTSKVPRTTSKVPRPRSKVQGPRSHVRGPRSKVQGPRSGVRYGSCCALSVASRYEELAVWQQARSFCGALAPVVAIARSRSDHALCNQLNSASVSTVANIAEGFLRRNDKEFANFLRISAASNGEVRTLLYLANDRGHLSDADLGRLLDTNRAIEGMLRSLIRYLKAGPMAGGRSSPKS